MADSLRRFGAKGSKFRAPLCLARVLLEDADQHRREERSVKRKPANLPRGKSMNPEERAVEEDARKETWLTKILRNTRLAKGRPAPDRKSRPGR
jgi:hypothetical protein